MKQTKVRFSVTIVILAALLNSSLFAAAVKDKSHVSKPAKTGPREMVFSKKYLNLPVERGAVKIQIDILIDGNIAYRFDIELAGDKIDYWVALDISEYKGKKAEVLLTPQSTTKLAFERLYQSDVPKEADSYYREKNRQQFQFSAQRGWTNDTNGMVYYDGEYHLFFQHNPFATRPGNTSWGHAVSKDMVHWEELNTAIRPDAMGPIWSGSAVVDKDNVAGFQSGKEKTIICFYTSAGERSQWGIDNGAKFTQSIAYSNDRGRTWTKYQGNPVVEHIELFNRDPRVIWYEPSKRWVMVLYLNDDKMQFLTSKNLKDWTQESVLVSFYECPELLEMPIDGNKNNMKWVFSGASGEYLIGDFDSKKFVPDHAEPKRFSYGNCFYASQTFNNMPDERTVQMAWGKIDTPDMPFNQCVLFPVELGLATTDDGLKMTAVPIREVELLHGKKHTLRDVHVLGHRTIDSLNGELFHIILEFKIAEVPEQFRLDVRGKKVIYRVREAELSCEGQKASLKPVDGKIRLEMLIDRNSLEIFANDGLVYMPIGGIFEDNQKSITMVGDDYRVKNITVYELDSIWH